MREMLCRICGSTVKVKPPHPAECIACGAMYLWKQRSHHYVFAGFKDREEI